MSRTGVEDKPAWRSVPAAVRDATAAAVGAPVARAMRVYGGYGPTPTFRLRLTDGRRAFFKGTSPESNAFSVEALTREIGIYRDLRHLFQVWAPQYIADFALDGWQAMLLEDLGPKTAPPWTPALARRVLQAYADYHTSSQAIFDKSGLPQLSEWFAGPVWNWAWAADSDGLQMLSALAGPRAGDALAWLESSAPVLRSAAGSLLNPRWPHVLLHCDTRSDNLRWRDGRLYLLDWPHARIGPPEFDLAAFAQSVTAEGGPEPETLIAWYAERADVRDGAIDAAVSACASYFANHSWAPPIEGLPRIRTWQQQQLIVTLAWAARRLGLPEPRWLDAIRP
jgi:hypothetical protein